MKAILQWVLKTMMKDQTGIVRTMPKKDLVDFNVAMTAERLMRNGIDPNSLKNANQVENAINQIEAPRNVNTGIRQTESAKIMDMEGKEIDPRSKIMGGKQSETEAEIAERLSRENKESAARIKNKKIVKDAIDNASPGFVKGDRKYNAQLVAEDLADKKFGKEFYDLDQRQQMDLYDEALDGLSVDLDDFAQGGRAGFKVGSPSKRTFLKVMGGLAATLAAIKSGLIGAPKKEITKQIVKETATDVASAPPQYFFDLANKIKLLGKPSKVKPQERVEEYSYIGKNGDEYTLTEDIGTGDMQIIKDKGGIGIADDKSFDTIKDRTVMDYRKGRGDETTKGTPADEYDEFKVEFDRDGTMGDGDVIDENIKKEIIEEASDIPKQKIKRAGGGVAYMLGE